MIKEKLLLSILSLEYEFKNEEELAIWSKVLESIIYKNELP